MRVPAKLKWYLYILANVAKPARTSPYIFDLNCQPGKLLEVSTEPYNGTKKEMEATHLTISTLLEYGANPNCGDVPYPPLILSLFTENLELVKEVGRYCITFITLL